MNEFEDTLTRLFASTREAPTDDHFVAAVTVRMERERRRRPIKLAALAVAGSGIALALTPYVAAGSLAVAIHFGAWLTSPMGWACSLGIAAWVLRRARRLA